METHKLYFGDSYAHYAQAGEKGPAVIVLHGWSASLKQWEWILPTLANAGYTAYALDLPGHGQAPRLSHHHTIEDHLDYIYRWMQALGIQQPIFLGHSMGGYLSLEYALDYPGTISGLVLIDPLYSHHQFNRYHQLARRLSNSPEALKIVETLFRHIPIWLIEATYYWYPHDVGRAPATLRRQVAIDHNRADPRIVHMIAIIEDLRPRLRQLRVPALVAWGGQDHLLPPSSFESLVELLPEAEAHCFPDVGHHPHLAHTESFVERVLAFLQEISDGHCRAGSMPTQVNHPWTSNTTALLTNR